VAWTPVPSSLKQLQQEIEMRSGLKDEEMI
jgi:hypothetical protein